ncbi:beta-lactamase family protein [Hypoxylon crocopeplum]|nr:beta-lactamase family protein [Hypoxylon crocopeplum]
MDLFYTDEFSARVRELMDRHRVPGLAIAVVQDEEIASKSYGYACLEPEEPCTEDTLFDIASSSKSLTAASVGLLVEDNGKYPEVQYDATMSNLLPDDFVMPDFASTDGVTVDDVLGHRTGMAGHDCSYMGPQAAQPDDAQSITRNLRNLLMAAPLRSRYLYCNIMYTVATHLVEVKTGQSFSDFLEQRFFQPLGMDSTSLQPTTARAKGLGNRIATGYLWDKKSSTYHGFPGPDCPEGQGAGSIITSVNDYIKWIKALMHHEGPISEKVYQGLIRMRSFVNPSGKWLKPFTSPIFYTAGMEIYYYRGHAVVGHNGVITGFGSRFFFMPVFKFGAVIMGNSDTAVSVANALTRQLIDAVLKVPKQEQSSQAKPGRMPRTFKKDLTVRPKIQALDQGENTKKDSEKNNPRDRPKSEGSRSQETRRGKKSSPQEAPRPQVTSLSMYTGRYRNPGYHSLTVQVKSDKLFVDATDRSTGFTLTFEHVSDQTKYIAHLCDELEEGDEPIRAEFVFENGRAVSMGLELEEVLKELIWFDLENYP